MSEEHRDVFGDIGKDDPKTLFQRKREVKVLSEQTWRRRLLIINLSMIALALLGGILLYVARKVDSEAVEMAAFACLLGAVATGLASRWLPRLKRFKDWMG